MEVLSGLVQPQAAVNPAKVHYTHTNTHTHTHRPNDKSFDCEPH